MAFGIKRLKKLSTAKPYGLNLPISPSDALSAPKALNVGGVAKIPSGPDRGRKRNRKSVIMEGLSGAFKG